MNMLCVLIIAVGIFAIGLGYVPFGTCAFCVGLGTFIIKRINS